MSGSPTADVIAYFESHTVGIIGHGHFGQLVEQLLPAPEQAIKVHDTRHVADGKLFHMLEDAARCDIVILAVPMRAFEEVLKRVLACGGSGVLVNVCTAQEHFVELLKKLAPERAWASFHAMFGPEGVKKRNGRLKGLRLVATEHHNVPESAHALALQYFEELGLQVVTMTAAKHDELLAESLFLVQYVGRAAAIAKFVRSAIGTVSFDLFMDAVEIVVHDKELFKDVVRFVHHCAVVRRRFHEGLARTDEEYEDALRAV